jgi:predicted ATPase
MLAEVSFENFKSYRKAKLPLAPLTLLIGANASGKSNAIEGLRFLSWLAQDHKLSSIRYEVQDKDDLVRGTVSDLPYFGSQEFRFGCVIDGLWEHPYRVGPGFGDWDRFTIRIKIDRDELRIVDERVTSPKSTVPLYEVAEPASEPSHDVKVAYNNFARGGRKPKITCSDQQAVFLQLQSAARFEAGHTKAQQVIPQVAGAYQKMLAEILFLDPSPRAMRGYSFRGDSQLRGDGRNLSGVLHGLCAKVENSNRVLDFIASLPEQNITGLKFIDTPRGEVMLRLTETFGAHERPVDAPLLSDGTLRVLAVAAAVLSAPEGSMVVIEEIDNGVHPSRANQLLRNIRSIADERRLRVVLTTHNPALMDALPSEALDAVVFCYRDSAEGDSRLVRIVDLDRAPSLLAQGSLGDLVTRGVLDRFVKDRPSAEEERRRHRVWRKELEQVGRE